MDIINILIKIIFIIINLYILTTDILERKIRNRALIALIILVPIWNTLFFHWNSTFLVQIVLSITFIFLGILSYTKNGFIGSGDIKYAAILALFLGSHSLATYISNIGILTIGTLLIWWSFIFGYVYSFHWLTGGKKFFNLESLQVSKSGINMMLYNIVIDWIIIGFLITLIIKNLSQEIFGGASLGNDIYFLITIYTLILRPGLHFLITKWQYKILPQITIVLYFGFIIRELGIMKFLLENIAYIQNIWIYALSFYIIRAITLKTFTYYDKTMLVYGISNSMKTIPYSIIIFTGFILLSSFNVNLMNLLNNI